MTQKGHMETLMGLDGLPKQVFVADHGYEKRRDFGLPNTCKGCNIKLPKGKRFCENCRFLRAQKALLEKKMEKRKRSEPRKEVPLHG